MGAFTRLFSRLRITSDPNVSTETCAVIVADTTNANLVIAPNGTGGLIASIPDGTATGGAARGDNAVDLQTVRGVNTQVAGGQAVIVGGSSNTAAGTQSVAVGGQSNRANTLQSFIGGGNANSILTAGENAIVGGTLNTNNGVYGFIGAGLQNTVSVAYGVVSGGQSNTASTGTHATVVGGQSNVASGEHATVIGGYIVNATGSKSVAGGRSSIASELASFAMGFYAYAQGRASQALGEEVYSQGSYSLATGYQVESYLYGQQAFGSGAVGGSASSQQSFLTARRSASLNSAATTVLSLDGTGVTNLIIPSGNNRMWNVQVRWVAVVTTITGTATGVTVGDTKVSTDLLAVAKRTGVTTVGTHTSAGTSVIETIAGSLTAVNITYSAGASQEMAITFTGPTFAGGGSVTMRVVAAISLTEVAY